MQKRNAFAIRRAKAVAFNLHILESLSQAERHNSVPTDSLLFSDMIMKELFLEDREKVAARGHIPYKASLK